MWTYLLKFYEICESKMYVFIKVHTVELAKKTKNKKFFFQQIILIFAVLQGKFLQIVFV